MTAAAILCLIGTAIKSVQVTYTTDRYLGIRNVDYATTGKVSKLPACSTYIRTCDSSIWAPTTCPCYDTLSECETARTSCEADVYANNNCINFLFEPIGETCSTMNATMYAWCNDNDKTKYFSGCTGWNIDYGFTSSAAAQQALELARTNEKVRHQAEMTWRKPYTGIIWAALVCDVGVFLFGLLAAQENEFKGADGMVTVVATKKGAKQVV